MLDSLFSTILFWVADDLFLGRSFRGEDWGSNYDEIFDDDCWDTFFIGFLLGLLLVIIGSFFNSSFLVYSNAYFTASMLLLFA